MTEATGACRFIGGLQFSFSSRPGREPDRDPAVSFGGFGVMFDLPDEGAEDMKGIEDRGCPRCRKDDF